MYVRMWEFRLVMPLQRLSLLLSFTKTHPAVGIKQVFDEVRIEVLATDERKRVLFPSGGGVPEKHDDRKPLQRLSNY